MHQTDFRRLCAASVVLFWLCGLVLALCPPVLCAPNGLTQIPIAKVFGDGVADFSVERVFQQEQTTTYTTQYGVGNELEFGLDYQAAPSEARMVMGNVKYLLAHRPGKLPDIAFGLGNVANGQKAVPYIVATTQPKATGISLGLIRPSGSGYEGMVGVSYNVTPALEIVADEIGGRDSYSTLGIVAAVTKTITLNVAYAQPNTSDGGANPRGYIFNLAYTFHLKGGAQKGDGAQRGGAQPGTNNKNPAGGAVGGAGQ